MTWTQGKPFRFLLLWGAYYLLGRLGLLLAIPPGYATAIWPASGIALAALLAWGPGYWPAIWLGSFCLNAATGLGQAGGAGILRSVAFAAWIASGASLQALAGRYLIRRFGGAKLELLKESEIIKFMLLGGPVSCLINPSLSVLGMGLLNLVPWNQAGANWWTWWVGDTLGVLVTAPLFLIEMLEPRAFWIRRRITVGLPLVLLFGLTVLTFVHVSNLEQQRARGQFEVRSELVAAAASRHLGDSLELVRSLGSFYGAVGGVDRELFRNFAGSLQSRHPWIQSLSWNLAVQDEGRPAVESAARRTGLPDFRFYELNASGRRVIAPHRRTYVVTSFIRPRVPSNEAYLGYNLQSDPVLNQALQQARLSGKAAAGIRILPGSPRDASVWLLRPVYERSADTRAASGGRGRLRGYIGASFDVSQLMAQIFSEIPGQGMELAVCDEAATGDLKVLWSNSASLAEACSRRDFGWDDREEGSAFLFVRPLAWANRDLRLVCRGAMGRTSLAKATWGPWSVLAVGMLFTALMGSFLLAATGRSAVIQRMAVERARDMADVNEDLRKEIVDRKAAEENLKKREAELVQAQKMEVVGRLSGGVAHDFNNMLTVVLGSAKLAQKEPGLQPQVEAYLKDIQSAGEKAADLTQRLLAMSRKQVLQPRIIDLNALLRETLPLVRRIASEEVLLSIQLEDHENHVYADAAQLQQAIINLAINARDAMPKGGRIEMGVRRIQVDNDEHLKPGLYEELHVSDSGSGIDPEILPHIFEPFFTTKGHGKGTGLGLAMVYGIVTQSGGALDVRSEPGKGSTFSIRLPHVAAALEKPVEPSEETADLAARSSETLLLVEDDEQVRRLLVEVLGRRGYKVHAVEGGAQALELLKQAPADLRLMISDMTMPGMGGRELAHEAARLMPGLPVLLVSGYVEPEDFSREFGPGVFFMPKPLAPDALQAKVREILGTRAS